MLPVMSSWRAVGCDSEVDGCLWSRFTWCQKARQACLCRVGRWESRFSACFAWLFGMFARVFHMTLRMFACVVRHVVIWKMVSRTLVNSTSSGCAGDALGTRLAILNFLRLGWVALERSDGLSLTNMLVGGASLHASDPEDDDCHAFGAYFTCTGRCATSS